MNRNLRTETLKLTGKTKIPKINYTTFYTNTSIDFARFNLSAIQSETNAKTFQVQTAKRKGKKKVNKMHKIETVNRKNTNINTNTISRRVHGTTKKIVRAHRFPMVTVEWGKNFKWISSTMRNWTEQREKNRERLMRDTPLGSLMSFLAWNAMERRYRRSGNWNWKSDWGRTENPRNGFAWNSDEGEREREREGRKKEELLLLLVSLVVRCVGGSLYTTLERKKAREELIVSLSQQEKYIHIYNI